MKKILFTSLIIAGLLVITPTFAGAHGVTTNEDGSMMQTQNSASFSGDFVEMEAVMDKMMRGEELSATETEEIVTFMQNHHGSGYGMMGMMGPYYGHGDSQGWMMNQGGSFFPWVAVLMILVWLLAGILVTIYLFRKLSGAN